MLQRGYIILIAGAILIITGITFTAVYGIGLADIVLSKNAIISDVSINSSASVNRTLQITNTEHPISIALHVESVKDSAEIQTKQQQASNVAIIEEVRNPGGVIINKNQFNSRSDDNKNEDDGLFTTFKPDVQGEYTLTIINLGSSPVKVGGIFGYLPIIGNNNQVNLQPLSGIIAGVILFIVGIITLIVGAIITILDRRRKKRTHFRIE
jgi:sulfite exporter TauE/SafE